MEDLQSSFDAAPASIPGMPELQALAGSPAASLAKVPVTIQVLLGSARLPLAELLALKQGSHFALEQKLGAPVTVIVNGCKIASGELFVLEGDTLGVKIKDIFSGSTEG